MKIKEFIQNEVLLPRLRKHAILVVYDREQRYRDLCLELAGENRRVVDAGDSSIESRELALATLQEMGQPSPQVEALLVYVPAPVPVAEEQKQRDPFAVYGVCGAVFPEGDGDEYVNLCLKARADHAAEIRRIFEENQNPTFAVIDAVGGGTNWPNLQALLNVESARDILFALLAPSEVQAKALKGPDAWVSEARDLFRHCLGLKLATRGKTWAALAEELWRFVLFSEFAFDLPAPLPEALADVPRATPEAKPVVEDVCDRLRNDRRTQSRYIEWAEKVEKGLNLPTACADIQDLGARDTFPFEERSPSNGRPFAPERKGDRAGAADPRRAADGGRRDDAGGVQIDAAGQPAHRPARQVNRANGAEDDRRLPQRARRTPGNRRQRCRRGARGGQGRLSQ